MSVHRVKWLLLALAVVGGIAATFLGLRVARPPRLLDKSTRVPRVHGNAFRGYMWASDRYAVYVNWTPNGWRRQVVLLDAQSGATRELGPFPARIIDTLDPGMTTISPDGKWLVSGFPSAAPVARIGVTLDGRRTRSWPIPTTRNDTWMGHLVWLPDGRLFGACPKVSG